MNVQQERGGRAEHVGREQRGIFPLGGHKHQLQPPLQPHHQQFGLNHSRRNNIDIIVVLRHIYVLDC